MIEGEHSQARKNRTASTRVVVEAAIDFSKGANTETWETYRATMAKNISPWRRGGFFVEERFADVTEEI
jgi:hypothetical protein